jgi:hypothetical protein
MSLYQGHFTILEIYGKILLELCPGKQGQNTFAQPYFCLAVP